jgi:hypothetical protein
MLHEKSDENIINSGALVEEKEIITRSDDRNQRMNLIQKTVIVIHSKIKIPLVMTTFLEQIISVKREKRVFHVEENKK